MGHAILKWFQLILGVIAFILSVGLILRDIVIGLKQKALTKKVGSKHLYKVSLSPDFVGFVRMGIPIGILMLMSLLVWKEDSVLGLILITCFGLLGIIWVASRPTRMHIGVSDDKVLLVNWKVQEVKTIICQTQSKDSDTIEIECHDIKGDKIEIECERTDENIRVINLVKDSLTTDNKKH